MTVGIIEEFRFSQHRGTFWQTSPLKRLHIIAEVILPKSQCGYRPPLCTIDITFPFPQLQENAAGQQQSLYMFYVDLSKAFDTVNTSALWILIRSIGCPETVVEIIKEFHYDIRLEQCLSVDQVLIHLKLATG